jgi:hypothetical protein
MVLHTKDMQMVLIAYRKMLLDEDRDKKPIRNNLLIVVKLILLLLLSLVDFLMIGFKLLTYLDDKLDYTVCSS